MTMLTAMQGRHGAAGARDVARIAGVHVLHSVGAAESIWRDLEGDAGLLTPFQRYDFLAAWQTNVGRREGYTPHIVVAHDGAGLPLALFPLVRRTRAGVHFASFMGDKHATFNMPLWRKSFAQSATHADLAALTQALAAKAEIDLLAFERQPARWCELANPMALLAHQDTVNECPLKILTPGAGAAENISNSFRRRLKGKERKLQALPGYRYLLAREHDDITRLLDAFFIVKPQHMAAQKLPNVFADPGVPEFIRAASHARVNGGYAIEIHALECDNELLALFAGVADGHRFSMMFNTYTMSDYGRHSPGLILLRYIVDHYAAAGYTSLDLGVGAAGYKRLFCKDDEHLFDSFIPLSAAGTVAAAILSTQGRAKRFVKRSPFLMKAAQSARGLFVRKNSDDGHE